VTPNFHRWGRVPIILASLVVSATLLGPALGASASKTPSKSTTTTTKPSLECSAKQLSFSGPVEVAQTTGEQALEITLTNVSSRLCQVHGYPTVRFYTSDGRLLTFSYRHSSQYFRRTTPRVLNLAPRARAYFVIAKDRCDTGTRYVASFFYVLPLYTSGSPWVGHLFQGGISHMDYCKGSSRGPGQSLSVSAIVNSLHQLTP
jgi:Protein of unknown function (DUF4232)